MKDSLLEHIKLRLERVVSLKHCQLSSVRVPELWLLVLCRISRETTVLLLQHPYQAPTPNINASFFVAP